MSQGWLIEEATGSAREFHARPLPDPVERTVWILSVTRAALVLGSTQGDAVVDHAAVRAAGVDLVHRRSGGGAVLLEPGGAVWVDVVLPAGDPLWSDDVGRAPIWLGRCWAAALADLGRPGVVHEGRPRESEWSRLVCFAGLGAGEVTVDGRKVVGVAQRRTKEGVRFQSAAHLRWDPDRLLGLLALSPAERTEAQHAVEPAAAPAPAPAGRLLDTLVAHLPA